LKCLRGRSRAQEVPNDNLNALPWAEAPRQCPGHIRIEFVSDQGSAVVCKALRQYTLTCAYLDAEEFGIKAKERKVLVRAGAEEEVLREGTPP